MAVDRRVADDGEVFAGGLDVVGAGFQGNLYELVFIHCRGWHQEQTLGFEHPGHAAGGAELAAGLLENLAHFRGRAVAVIGQNIAHHRHAADAVTLVANLFQVPAGQLTRAFLDGPGDVVLGHADFFGVVDGVAQPQVGAGVATAHFGRDDDRLGTLAPDFAATVVDEGFFVFDTRPVGMA